MGQGLYDMLGWGVLNPPVLTSTDQDGTIWLDDALFQAVAHVGLRVAYETAPPYLVIPLAVSTAWLQERWALPDVPRWCPRIAPRRARVLLRGHAKEVMALARAQGMHVEEVWQAAQRIYAERGLTLPEARLILLSDWH